MATVRLIPSAYTVSSSNRVNVSSATNMYYNTDHTANYCSIRGRNSSSSGPYYAFIHGFNFDSVPSDVIVTSFAIKIRCYRNSYLATGSSYRLRLANTASSSSAISNTTLSSDITTTSGGTVYTFPNGNLEWEDIVSYGSNFSIEVPLMSTSNQYPYLYVYGAEIEVTYTTPVYHNVTGSSNVSGVSIVPTSESVLEGKDVTFTIESNGSTFKVKDNDVDVTNQLVQVPSTGSNTEVPSGYTNLTSGVTINSSYPITNAYKNADSTSNYCRLDYGTSTTGYIELLFDLPTLPSDATLTSISARARLRISSTSRMTNTICRLYSGSTAKGSNVTITSTSSGGSLLTLSPGSWTASEISDLRMRIGATSSSSTSSKYIYIYGADVSISYELNGEVYTYTISNVTTDHTVVVTTGTVVHVTGVSVSPASSTIEIGNTIQLAATVSPSDATDKSVTWSSNRTSVATVSSTGLVTGVSAGSATITVTTTDGGYTATCNITVAAAVTYTYKLATSMVVGKKYLIANGNSGSVYLLSNESGGSRQLVGIAATVSNNKISVTSAVKAKAEFECVRYTAGNDVTITVKSDNKYLYSDNSSGLRLESTSSLNRFWHYRNNKFWQFKSTSSDGYTDTSSEYKYYLKLNSSNNFTDSHVTSPSIEDSTLPEIYIYVEDDGTPDETIYLKTSGSWIQCSKVYKKINGEWVEQEGADWETILTITNNYRLIRT